MVDKSQQTEVTEKKKHLPIPQSSGPKGTLSIGNIPGSKFNYECHRVSSQLQQTWTKRKHVHDMTDKSLQTETAAEEKEEIKSVCETVVSEEKPAIGEAAPEFPESVQEVEIPPSRQTLSSTQNRQIPADQLYWRLDNDEHSLKRKIKGRCTETQSSGKNFVAEHPEFQPTTSNNEEIRQQSINRVLSIPPTKNDAPVLLEDGQDVPAEVQPPTAEESSAEVQLPLAEEITAEEPPAAEEAPVEVQPSPTEEAPGDEAPDKVEPTSAEETLLKEPPAEVQPSAAEDAPTQEVPELQISPAVESPEEEAPAEIESPPAEVAPAELQSLPAEEAPAEKSSANIQSPPTEETSAEEVPEEVQSLPAEDTPAEEASTKVQSPPAERTLAEEAAAELQPLPAEEASAEEAPAEFQLPSTEETTSEMFSGDKQSSLAEESFITQISVKETSAEVLLPPSEQTPADEALVENVSRVYQSPQAADVLVVKLGSGVLEDKPKSEEPLEWDTVPEDSSDTKNEEVSIKIKGVIHIELE
ncbi:hypothetical protein EI555_010896 [Monodon monoceros]|uniref:Fibrous sheath CABYR-binding protein n=1 Tax=Monodon monoceros TaxID=40151 RepID=A0A4U1EHB9_MONMO|nr:hypothetical protein EI555_010896 [Monodon monoceros]